MNAKKFLMCIARRLQPYFFINYEVLSAATYLSLIMKFCEWTKNKNKEDFNLCHSYTLKPYMHSLDKYSF